MIEIDARTQWKTDEAQPGYLRGLIAMTGMSQRRCAALLGVTPREMRSYLLPGDRGSVAPYTVQFGLEMLAECEQLRLAL